MSDLLRPPTDDDAVLAARLMSEHWPEPVGEERVLGAWTSPRVDRGMRVAARFDIYEKDLTA